MHEYRFKDGLKKAFRTAVEHAGLSGLFERFPFGPRRLEAGAYRIAPQKGMLLPVIAAALLFFSFSLCVSITRAYAGEGHPASLPALQKRIIILPFTNYTDSPNAVIAVTDAVRNELAKTGWQFASDSSAVEDFLAKRRIRYTGGVTRLMVREMGRVLNADAVMVGSVDLFSEESDEAVVGATLRLVDAADGNIIWADSLSYTGRDFEGIFELGIIKSADSLSSRVAASLVKGMPGDFHRKDGAYLSPFEAAGVVTTPPVARTGDNIRVSIRMLPIMGEPKEVRVSVGGKETVFEKERADGYYYEGVIEAPAGEGVHPVDVIAIDTSMRPYTFRSAGKIAVRNTPPNVAITADRKVFSPRRKGFVLFTPALKDIEDIDEWSMEILDSEGKVVRGEIGFGRLPKKLVWRGEGNDSHMVDDGDYRYRFTVKIAANNQTILSDTLKVKSKPPEIQVAVGMSEDRLFFTFGLPSKDEALDSWRLSVFGNGGKVVKIFNGKGALPPGLECPVAEGDLNSMSFAVTATDIAGNTFELKKAITSVLRKNSPFAKHNEKSRFAEDF